MQVQVSFNSIQKITINPISFQKCFPSCFKKNTLWPLFMDGVQLPQGYSHFEEVVYFLPLSSQKFLALILLNSEGWKGWPWIHPVVLNMGPLDWESKALTTRPANYSKNLYEKWKYLFAPIISRKRCGLTWPCMGPKFSLHHLWKIKRHTQNTEKCKIFLLITVLLMQSLFLQLFWWCIEKGMHL